MRFMRMIEDAWRLFGNQWGSDVIFMLFEHENWGETMDTETKPLEGYDLWLAVCEHAYEIKRKSGWGAEAGWSAEVYEADVDGVSYEATHYASEAYTSYALRRYDTEHELWVEVWHEMYQ